MSFSRSIRIAGVTLGFSGLVCAQSEERQWMQETISELRIQNQELQRAITEANRAEKQASEQLARVRRRLSALGEDLLDGGNDRLVEAVADRQVLQERVHNLESGAAGLGAAVEQYLQGAENSNPQDRLGVEIALRELDELLGLRQKPRPAQDSYGSANRAKVMSVDPESGLVVFNVGENHGARIGTTYRLYRGDQAYGSAVLADVRDNIAGAFVDSLDDSQGPVRLGDLAILEIE